METNKNNIINDKFSPRIYKLNNKYMNGAFDKSKNGKEKSENSYLVIANNKKSNNINSIPKNKRRISQNKGDYTNSSFITFRKNSDINPNKKNDNSITLNENNINVVSLSNISNINLINNNNKNESIFRKINHKENIKDSEHNSTINQINNIYDNKFQLKLRLNKDEIIKKNKVNKISNKVLPRNFKNANYFTKIKKSNYNLIRSKTFNANKDFDINNLINTKISQIFCFICKSHDEKFYHAKNCYHYFCKQCGKTFFDQQVQRVIYTLKCPKYDCDSYLNLNSIKEILSKETFIKLDTYQKINHNFNKMTSIKLNEKIIPKLFIPKLNQRNSFETITNESCKGLNCFKSNFLQIHPHKKNIKKHLSHKNRHILKIDNSAKLRHSIQIEKEKNKIICTKCKKPSLFKRDDLSFIRCLNCDNVFCKFCLKKFNNPNHRRYFICAHCYLKRKKRNKLSFLNKMKYEILFVFSGFFVFIIGFTKYEIEFVLRKKRKCFILYIIFFVIIFCFNFIIAILFFPYFPVITMLFE